jgi:hypothetical protein
VFVCCSAGCIPIPDDRPKIPRDIADIESGRIKLKFDSDYGRRAERSLSDFEFSAILEGLKKCHPLNKDVVEIGHPSIVLVVATDDRHIGFLTRSKVPGTVLLNYMAYSIDPESDEWKRLNAVFEHEEQVRSD